MPVSYTHLDVYKRQGGFHEQAFNQRKKPFGSLAMRTLGDMFPDIEQGAKNGLEPVSYTHLVPKTLRVGIHCLLQSLLPFFRLIEKHMEAGNFEQSSGSLRINVQTVTIHFESRIQVTFFLRCV